MKLILKQNVENLGQAGDVVTVKPGYGRNYLLPHGLAYIASEANMARIEEERAKAEEAAKKDFLEARRRASQLEGMTLSFTERADGEKLFGSVTLADIVAKANESEIDFELEKKSVLLDEPIKTIGDTEVTIRLHADVALAITVSVEAEEG